MRRIIPALAAALACAACTAPIFDPGMSASVALFDHSVVVGSSRMSIGADLNGDQKPDWDLRRESFIYLPVRVANTIDPDRGFVIRRKEYDNWNEVWFQWWDGIRVKWMGSPAGYGEDDVLPWRWPVTLKNGTSLAAVQFEGDPDATWVDRLWADTATEYCDWNPGYHSYDIGNAIQVGLGLGLDPVVVGMSVKADALPGQDRLHVLVREGVSFSEAETLVSDPGPGVFNSIMGIEYPLPFLGDPRHLLYFRDPDNQHSFAQWPMGSGWETWIWFGPAGPANAELLPVASHRIAAVLSQDAGPAPATYLLSIEKQEARIYKVLWDGSEFIDSEVAGFSLGTLRFIGEMYTQVAGDWNWYLVFSRSLVEGDTLRFEIRALKTEDLVATFGR